MLSWLSHLDRLLRGETTRPESLRDGRFDVPIGGMAVVIILLGAIYGACMGTYSLTKTALVEDPNPPHMQLIASTVKVPALFYLTLLVTFPSLYVFNALVGSRLSLVNVLRLLVASLAVNLAVLASLGPIVVFFSVSTNSYSFILLLNVAAFSVAGFFGLVFLLQTLHRMTAPAWPSMSIAEQVPAAESDQSHQSNASNQSDQHPDEPSALDMPAGQALGEHTRLVFRCWMAIFALVGAQMGWVLRPFVGNPTLPFEWFRPRQSNFFEAVLIAVRNLFTGGG